MSSLSRWNKVLAVAGRELDVSFVPDLPVRASSVIFRASLPPFTTYVHPCLFEQSVVNGSGGLVVAFSDYTDLSERLYAHNFRLHAPRNKCFSQQIMYAPLACSTDAVIRAYRLLGRAAALEDKKRF